MIDFKFDPDDGEMFGIVVIIIAIVIGLCVLFIYAPALQAKPAPKCDCPALAEACSGPGYTFNSIKPLYGPDAGAK